MCQSTSLIVMGVHATCIQKTGQKCSNEKYKNTVVYKRWIAFLLCRKKKVKHKKGKEIELCIKAIKTSHLTHSIQAKSSRGGKKVITPSIPFSTLRCAYEISLLNPRCLISLGGFGQFGNLSNRWIKQRYRVRVVSLLLPVFRMWYVTCNKPCAWARM